MQRITLTLMLSVAAGLAIGQTCKGYYYMQDHKTVTMSLTNKKGKPSGKYVYKIVDVKDSGTNMTSTIRSEVFDEKDKSIATSVANIKCASGTYLMDMKMMMPQQQAEQFKNMDAKSEFWLEYPVQMKVGDALKDGSFSSDIKDEKGMDMRLEMNITDRKVDAVEEVTTPAGTWKCYRITLSNKIKTIVAGIGIPFTVTTTEWFAPGFGVVRSESKWGRTEISSIL